jgi:inositol-phosphate transport system ATP-binding protein
MTTTPAPFLRVEGVATRAGRVSFEARAGEAVALVGPNGSGKSTLLYAIAGMHRVGEGRILVHDRDLGDLSYDEMRKHRTRTGYVFEAGGFLSNRSVLDNMVMPLAYHGRATLALATIHVKARGLASEIGLDRGLDLVGAKVSLHTQRLAMFARALILDPELLLVDAPKATLSPRERTKIAGAIERRRKQRQMTVVYADTDAALAPFIADRVVHVGEERLSSLPPPSSVTG